MLNSTCQKTYILQKAEMENNDQRNSRVQKL